jgi:hypothetical protein
MKRMLVAFGAMCFVCTATQAQEAKPGADLKKLDMWVGDWAYEEQGKDSASGEEWKLKGEGQLSRMGEFYVWRAKTEERELIAIWGYDPAKKTYFIEGFFSDGSRGTATATFGEKTLTWETTGLTATGEKIRDRCSQDFVTETVATCEAFADGKWTPSVKTTYTKVK